MITKLIDALNNLIADGASPETVQTHLDTIREQAEKLEEQHAALQLKVSEIQSDHPKPPVESALATDTCPYCQHVSGILQDRQPEESVGETGAGVKIHHYKCSNQECGKTYEKRVEH